MSGRPAGGRRQPVVCRGVTLSGDGTARAASDAPQREPATSCAPRPPARRYPNTRPARHGSVPVRRSIRNQVEAPRAPSIPRGSPTPLMEKSTPIGLGAGFVLVFGTIMLGDGWTTFFDPMSLLIVVGGTFAGLLVTFTVDEVKNVIPLLKGLFGFQPPDYAALADQLTDCRPHGPPRRPAGLGRARGRGRGPGAPVRARDGRRRCGPRPRRGRAPDPVGRGRLGPDAAGEAVEQGRDVRPGLRHGGHADRADPDAPEPGRPVGHRAGDGRRHDHDVLGRAPGEPGVPADGRQGTGPGPGAAPRPTR